MADTVTLLNRVWGGYRYAGVHDNSRPDDLIIWEKQDVEPIIERAKMLSEQSPSKEPIRHVAIIPRIVWNQSVREGWANDAEAWRKWANDPDNRAFRTWPGRI